MSKNLEQKHESTRQRETSDVYDPQFVADLFDRCSANYRRWSSFCSFGLIYVWRRQCVARLPTSQQFGKIAVDLMAGTGEIWPHLLRHLPDLDSVTALDISHRMHLEAVERLHGQYANKIMHIEANALTTDLPSEYADFVVSTFGLKMFNKDQQVTLARQIARILKPGGHFSLIEASDPQKWFLHPVYRFYLDRILPLVERFFLSGAKDFSMIGTYTKNFRNCSEMAHALKSAGLTVSYKSHFFGCATSVAGQKPN